jgi:tRNA/rRNA methyltransferase
MPGAIEDHIILEGEGATRTPIVSGTAVPVAAVVAAAHEQGHAAALTRWAAAGLGPAALEQVLIYCAERRCEAAGATCPGCRLRTEKLGIRTFDDFVARHAEVRSIRVRPPVPASGQAESLEAQSWAGSAGSGPAAAALRHGIRRPADRRTAADAGNTPVLIPVRPQLPTTRMGGHAMANFGLEHPARGLRATVNEKARIAASGANFIIDGAEVFASFEPSLAGLNWVCATTARQRDLSKPVLTPGQALGEVLHRLRQGQRCGIVFGPERNGLETGEVANADAVVMAPVNPNFASLNLAQAVLLLAYEWMKQAGVGTLGRVTTYEEPLQPGLRTRGSPPASRDELTAFFEHLERELDDSGFFTSPEKRPAWCRTCAPCSRAWAQRNRKSAPCEES